MTSISAEVHSGMIEEILIRFPAKPGYLSLCRINAATVGAMLGFSLDELDDLRLAVNEAVTWLLLGAGTVDGTVELSLAGDAGALKFVATRIDENLTDEPVDDLVAAILGATVDSYEAEGSATQRILSFSKLAATE